MRRLIFMMLALLVCLGGCAETEDFDYYEPAMHSGLLFDRYASYPSGADITYKSGWPSTFARYQYPEYVTYRETISDVQGRWPYGYDYTYRRFRMVRQGQAIR